MSPTPPELGTPQVGDAGHPRSQAGSALYEAGLEAGLVPVEAASLVARDPSHAGVIEIVRTLPVPPTEEAKVAMLEVARNRLQAAGSVEISDDEVVWEATLQGNRRVAVTLTGHATGAILRVCDRWPRVSKTDILGAGLLFVPYPIAVAVAPHPFSTAFLAVYSLFAVTTLLAVRRARSEVRARRRSEAEAFTNAVADAALCRSTAGAGNRTD